ncbi:hypothetical protein [Nocardia sp. NBC_00511]|uniref:hypothetical protein n=1 Tax=Nocardia sp. NBC_00511 TaxID=2903591 RepID=UPI002F910493
MNRRDDPCAAAARLPRGVTGFWTAGQAAPPDIDQREFRGVCDRAARLTGGRAAGQPSVGPARSFVAVSIVYPDRARTVLCNLHWPFIAIAEPTSPDDEATFVFMDDPHLAATISRISRYRALTRAELATPLAKCDLSELDDAELAQVRYWKPETVGDTLFNCWD